MARVLIVGGGCRGLELARGLVGEGHAVRVTTRAEAGREAIEKAGAECCIGTPDRLATLRYALDGVTIACWLLGTASGPDEAVRALHSTRLEFFLGQTIDTSVRGILYEAAGSVPAAWLAAAVELVRSEAERNAIPYALIEADPYERPVWLGRTRAAIDSLLAGHASPLRPWSELAPPHPTSND
jgi:hypothetical protein